jgi:hypothetical protein
MDHSALIFVALWFALSILVLVCSEIGYRAGRRAAHHEGTGAIEAAILGLLGLMLAFSFAAAQGRLEARRALAVEEANDIGTAYLRLDLLPASEQPRIRELFRRYLDARLRVYQSLPDRREAESVLSEGEGLQREIWSGTEQACHREQWTPAPMLILPAINQMIDITTARTLMLRTHNPRLVTGLLVFLAAIGAIVAGFAMSVAKTRNLLYMILFASTISITVCTVIELDHPRAGLVRGLENADKVLLQLRETMK